MRNAPFPHSGIHTLCVWILLISGYHYCGRMLQHMGLQLWEFLVFLLVTRGFQPCCAIWHISAASSGFCLCQVLLWGMGLKGVSGVGFMSMPLCFLTSNGGYCSMAATLLCCIFAPITGFCCNGQCLLRPVCCFCPLGPLGCSVKVRSPNPPLFFHQLWP